MTEPDRDRAVGAERSALRAVLCSSPALLTMLNQRAEATDRQSIEVRN